MENILNRKNLIGFSMVVLFYHVALTLFPWFEFVFPMFIVDYVLVGVLAVGWCVYWAKNRTSIRLQPAMVVLIGFMLWLVVSCIAMSIHYDNDWVTYNFAPNASSPVAPGLNAAVSLLFVFPLGIELIRQKDELPLKLGRVLLHILLLGWTVFMAIALFHVFQNKMMYTSTGGKIGMVNGNLELNCNQNITGSWEMTFLLLCCFMILWCKGLVWKGIYGVAGLIHYITLILSNSRASVFASLLGFMALAGITVFLKLKNQKTINRLLVTLVIAIIAGVAFYFLRRAVFAMYGVCTGIKVSGARDFLTGSGSYHLSGREEVWEASVKGVFSSPHTIIFGVTPKSTSELISQASGGAVNVSYTHNEFLEIAASMGLPGMAIFLVWLWFMARDTWKMYFGRDRKWTLLLGVPVIFVALLAANMMEAHLLFCEHLNGYVFFLLGGMIYGAMNEVRTGVRISRQEKRKLEREKR